MDGAVRPCSSRANILAGVLSMHALIGTLPPVENVCTVFAGGSGGAPGRGVAEAAAGATGTAAATAHDLGCALRIAEVGVGGTRSFTSVQLEDLSTKG